MTVKYQFLRTTAVLAGTAESTY